MRTVLFVSLLMLLAGCFGPEVRLPGSTEPHGTGVSGVIQHIAIAAAAIGSIGVFLAVAIAIFVKDFALAFKVGIAAVGTIVIAGIIHWIGSHLALAVGSCLAVLTLTAVGWVLVHRRYVVGKAEQMIGRDLNHDGMIGQDHA